MLRDARIGRLKKEKEELDQERAKEEAKQRSEQNRRMLMSK